MTNKLDALLAAAAKSCRSPGGLLHIDSLSGGFSYSGGTGHFSMARPDQALFHSASIGKAITAVLALSALDNELLDAPIGDSLPQGTLDRLFVHRGTDYQRKITPKHLLSHTSGAADYFDGPAMGSPRLRKLIVRDPGRRYETADLLEFSRRHQRAVAPPGPRFAYSDTGYILLGLAVEAWTGMPFHLALKTKIFEPLGMRDTRACFEPGQALPADGLGPTLLDGRAIEDTPALSADWAGGGLVTTAADLVRFARALTDGRLLDPDKLAQMTKFDQRFMTGIRYGLGLMQFRFGEYFPGLGKLPKTIGHMGVLGTQMMIDPLSGLALAISLNTSRGTAASVRLAIRALLELSKAKLV